MRGVETPQATMFSYVSLEHRVPKKHPLRTVRKLVDAALLEMDGALTTMYAQTGHPSIPPERLIRALLLQIFYSVRSERLLMEQLDYNLLFRWFVGLAVDDGVWDAVAKTKGYKVSQIVRKRIEEIFGWAKEIGVMSQVKLRGRGKVDWRFTMTLAAYNLVRMRTLAAT